MPIPEEKLYRGDKLNRWFAVSSILMTASIIWLIASDYNRPWRDFQNNYFVAKAALAHLSYLDATRFERQNDLEKARENLANQRELLKLEHGEEMARIEKEIEDASFEYKQVNMDFGQETQLLEVTRDSYEKALAAHGESHEETHEAKELLTEKQELVAELKLEAEQYKDKIKELETQLRSFREDVREAERLVRDIEKEQDSALEKDQQYRGVLTDEGVLAGIPIVDMVIHAPLLDFVAPKTTTGREQIKQLVLPDVRQRLNYLDSYTTDRCTTCHIAIDDPAFSKDVLAKKLEQSLPGIDDELTRRGEQPLGPLPPPNHPKTGKALPAGSVTTYWDELTKQQQDEYFEALADRVNGYLKSSGRKPLQLGEPLLAHPDLELYVSVDSPHPMAQMGCTVCHEGNPQETDFVQAAHSPPTHEIREEWADKYYVREMGIPTIDFGTVEHYWDRPMRLPKYSEAGCAKCHSEITDIAKFDGEKHGKNINLGRQLFVQVGCINCHNVEQLEGSPRVGPSLTHMASKLSREFAQKWIYFPQKFRPSTRMPHFFGQENNDESAVNQYDPHPEFRTETEVAAITQYLLSVSKSWKPIEKPEGVEGNVDSGRELFASLGCQGCHSNVALNGEEWITEDLIAREGLDQETAKYRYLGMTYEDRVHYAMEHFPAEMDSFLRPEAILPDGDGEYKAPYFSRFAPELSGIGSKVNFEWLYSWLIEPTHYSADTKMPSLRLSPQEAADVASYLLTLKNKSFDQTPFEMTSERRQEVEGLLMELLSAQNSQRRSRAIINDEGNELTKRLSKQLSNSDKFDEQSAYDLLSAMPLEDKQLYFLGNKMIAHYGCYTCHEIAGFEETSPVGTDLTVWAEKPIAQLDFAFFDHAFHHLHHEKEDVYGYVYLPDDEQLRDYSPLPDDTHQQITHTHGAFAKHKFLNPRIWDREKIKKPYDKLKMPNFYFTEREADALVTYMLSRIPPRVRGPLDIDYETTTSGPIARGRALTRELNCVGCHQFEDNDPMIQQYYRLMVSGEEVFDEVNAPPRLWGQGSKAQPDWMHGFFGNVETLRPWLRVRMPSFNLTENEKSDLVAYFASLVEHNADKLEDAQEPVLEYITDSRKKAGDAVEEPEAVGSDWYQDELLQDEAADLRRFALNRKLMRDRDFDFLSLSDERIKNAHADLLERTMFIRELYNIEFPFTEAPIKLSDDEYFNLGERFFVDMGCLKCHVMGEMLPGPAKNTDEFVQVYRLDGVVGEGEDAMAVINGVPYPVGAEIDGHKLVSAANVYNDTGDVDTSAIVEGENADGEPEKIRLQAASAPNLNLTYKRLQRDWFEAWMLQPQWIQPGTKMPQNFVDGVSPFEGTDDYPGNGADHIRLLTDYVYEAGVRGKRLPLPKLVVIEQEEFDEDAEFSEEDFD